MQPLAFKHLLKVDVTQTCFREQLVNADDTHFNAPGGHITGPHTIGTTIKTNDNWISYH